MIPNFIVAAIFALAAATPGTAATLRAAAATNMGPQSLQTVNVNVATTVDVYSRVKFVLGADIPAIVLGFPQWALAPGAGVSNPGNGFTITQAAIEIGSQVQAVAFTGSGNVVGNGANVLSDPLPASAFNLTKFPQGCTGWIRLRLTFANPATDKIAYSGGANSNAGDTGLMFKCDPTKVNVTNGIMGTGIFAYSMINGGVNGTDAVSYNPYHAIILGSHADDTVGFWGDSKTAGTGDTGNALGVIGMNRTLLPTKDIAAGARSGINFGNPSGVALDCTTAVGGASLSQLTYWYQYVNNAVVGYGTNSLNQGAQTALYAQIRAAGISKIIQRSLTPRSNTNNTEPVTITSLTTDGSTTTVTGTMANTSGLIEGQSYPISGATPTVYNGTYPIHIVNGTTFTYTVAGVPASNATGTITLDDQWRSLVYQTINGQWGVGSLADTFEQWLRGNVASDANLTYYQSLGERANTTTAGLGTTAYWQWGVNGTVKWMTADGLHESGNGYEANITTGTAMTQAGGTVAASLRAMVQALPKAASTVALPSSGLVARFSADSIVPVADNTAISSWTDQVSGLAVTQATGTAQPVYRAARLGGKPSVQFGGSKWLAGSFPSLKSVIDSKLYTVMIVVSNVVAAGNGTVFGNLATGGGAGFIYQATGSTIGRFDGGNVKTSVPFTGAGMATFGTISTTTPMYSGQSVATGNELLYVRGHRKGAQFTGPGPATNSTTGNFALGAANDNGLFSCKADVHEILVWNRVLSDLEWVQAEKWICSKYAQPTAWSTASSFDVYVGDSITAGIQSNDVTKSAPYLSAAARSRALGQWANHGIGGISWGAMTSHIPDWAALSNEMGIPLNVVAWEWYNEKNQGHTDSAAWTNCQTFVSTVRAYPTPTPGPIKLGLLSSTAYSGDAANYATVRGPYNGFMDDPTTGAASIADRYQPIHSDATAGQYIGNSTAVATYGTTYIGADGVHPTVAGYAYLAPVMTACLNAMRP
jgi:hypothetical protein